MAAIGELVDYHSPYRIGVFDAKITKLNDDGTVAVVVYVHGLAGRHENNTVALRSVSYGPEGRAKPRGMKNG